MMKRSRKVSWAPSPNLCQVRLFLSEDCPSQVAATRAQHKLKMKKPAQTLPSPRNKELDDLPPGFESTHYSNSLKRNLHHIPRVAWKCPPKVAMSYNWHVAAGEESQEVEIQKLRERKEFEAVYPRLSAIPPSPAISSDTQCEAYDDSRTPNIPLIPIEEEEAANMPNNVSSPSHQVLSPGIPPINGKPALRKLPDLGADLVAAASAAVTTIMKSKEQGGLIDTGLLVKILSDPDMIEKLVNGSQKPTTTITVEQTAVSEPVTRSVTSTYQKPTTVIAPQSPKSVAPPFYPNPSSTAQPAISVSGPKPVAPPISMPRIDAMRIPANTAPSKLGADGISLVMTVNPNHVSSLGLMSTQPNTIRQNSASAIRTNPVKDFNYFKNLIKEHGTETRSATQNGTTDHNQVKISEMGQNIRPKEVNLRIQKPCKYFKSPKGCRKGVNCPYQHDFSCQYQTDINIEAPPVKRMRIGEITGRT